MFNLHPLYNKDNDYNVSVSGAPDERIILNVCNNLVKIPKGCKGTNLGACILSELQFFLQILMFMEHISRNNYLGA